MLRKKGEDLFQKKKKKTSKKNNIQEFLFALFIWIYITYIQHKCRQHQER